MVNKLAQSRVQKTQIHQEGVAGQAQHILGQLVQALFLFGHGGSLLFGTWMLLLYGLEGDVVLLGIPLGVRPRRSVDSQFGTVCKSVISDLFNTLREICIR